jgi:predicted nucleotidyltransferase
MPGASNKTPVTGALRKAIRAVADALAALPARGMIIGGIGVIARGVPRATRDVDFTVEGGKIEVTALIDRLAQHTLVPRIEDAASFAADNQVLLLRHELTGVDVDLSIAWLPFELDALARASSIAIGGITVRVATAEDLVIYKAIAFRPQDQQDIERLVTLHASAIDLVRVRTLRPRRRVSRAASVS